LIAILGKEKHIAEEENVEGEDGMMVFAISSLSIMGFFVHLMMK
jgi:hypothetical protein